MYFPKGIRDRASGPGSFFVGGTASLSMVFGAAAFGFVGVVAGIVGLLVLFFVEVFREASRLDGENSVLRSSLDSAQKEVDLTQNLENKNAELEQLADELLGQLRQPAVGLEEILEGIATHLSYLRLVKDHRQISVAVADAPVTRIEMRDDGTVAVFAVCVKGCEQLDQQFVTIVLTASEQVYGTGQVIAFSPQGVTANFEIAALPIELADELAGQGSLTPHGYMLRLAGLCIEKYSDLEDKKISQLEAALSATSEALSSTLSGRDITDSSARLAELEADSGSLQTDGVAQSALKQMAVSERQGDDND